VIAVYVPGPDDTPDVPAAYLPTEADRQVCASRLDEVMTATSGPYDDVLRAGVDAALDLFAGRLAERLGGTDHDEPDETDAR
jgi:hypothetical protein